MDENYNEVKGHFAKQCLLFKQKNCRLQSAFSKHKQDKTGGKKHVFSLTFNLEFIRPQTVLSN